MMQPARVPAWVRVMDAAAIAAAVLCLFVVLFGGFSLYLGPLRISVHGPARLIFIAVALLAIRHAASPAEPLHRRVIRGLRAPAEGSVAAIVPAALATRAAVLLIGFFAVVTVGVPQELIGFRVSGNPVENLPARFDAGWYAGIALEGYSFEGRFDKQQNVAFFPAFPMLERAFGFPVGAFAKGITHQVRMTRLLWGGVFVSVIAFAWAAVYVWRLARDTIGEDRAAAAVALLSAYPFAIYFSAPYTESVFLLGSAAAIYHFRRDEFVQAALWGALVGVTRPNGCFLSIVLALILAESMWKRHRTFTGSGPSGFPRSQIAKSLLAASAPGLGMLAFSTYVHSLTGSFFGWARLHEAWGRSYSGLAPVERAYGWLTDEGLLRVLEGVPYDTMNSLALIFTLLMLWPVARRLGPAFAAFILINVVPPMLAGGVLSMGRLTATLFPTFLALAAMLRPRAITPLVTCFAMGQGLAAVLFFTWRPLF